MNDMDCRVDDTSGGRPCHRTRRHSPRQRPIPRMTFGWMEGRGMRMGVHHAHGRMDGCGHVLIGESPFAVPDLEGGQVPHMFRGKSTR